MTTVRHEPTCNGDLVRGPVRDAHLEMIALVCHVWNLRLGSDQSVASSHDGSITLRM